MDNRWGRASGIGSWPGTDVKEAMRTTFGELAGSGIPYLVELPARGPGSDLLGRGSVFLTDTPVDLQPSGWRLVRRPGRDLQRARTMVREDLDVLAEVADGYAGPLKIQVAGPWTLAAGLHLHHLEAAVSDAGACRDIVGALADGLARHVADLRRLLPQADIVVQVDEPSIMAVLGGALPTASGFGRLNAVEEQIVEDGLRTLLRAVTDAGAVETVVHCCAGEPPTTLFTRAGVDGVSVDTATLGVSGWETLAGLVESGHRVWAGAVPTTGPRGSAQDVADAVWKPWREMGLDPQILQAVVVTPSCGLATSSLPAARDATTMAATVATTLARRADGGDCRSHRAG
jgi:methionine synthase II (cobalamin-independent)